MSRRRLPSLPLIMLLTLLIAALARLPLVRASFGLNQGAIQYNLAMTGQSERLSVAASHLASSQQLPASQRLLGFIRLAEEKPEAALLAWRQTPEMAAELIRWGQSGRAGQTSWYAMAAQVDPAYEAAQIAYCNELLDGADYQAVRELYRQLPPALLEAPGLQVCAGAAELALGDAERAVSLVERAVTQAPERAAYWQWYSLALTRTGRFDQAISASAQATRLAPTVADYWEHQGNLHRESAQWDLARHAYEQAIALAPENESARAALANLPKAP